MLYRKSAGFLARKPTGSMSRANGIEYLRSVNLDGTPVFAPSENDATPLFRDYLPSATGAQEEADCMGELGVEWNPFVKRWVMLYNCRNNSPSNPRGIYMRTAVQPWGPWSAAQIIFDPVADGGYCHFMHRAVTAQNPTACDSVGDASRLDQQGAAYGPYFLSRFTSGDAARATSTFYFTMATWNPYGQVIMQATIEGGP
jgi:hypothetical protein